MKRRITPNPAQGESVFAVRMTWVICPPAGIGRYSWTGCSIEVGPSWRSDCRP
jgi:hypothetical protein